VADRDQSEPGGLTAAAVDSDPLRQAEAHAYQRASRRIGWADMAVSALVLLAVVAAADTLGGWGCVLVLAVVPALVSLPFGYAGYRLSVAHGLSRQTPGGWFSDRMKGFTLGIVLGGAALAAVLALQRLSDDWWPLLTWIAALVFSAALSVLFPVLLLPIFLRSEPLPGGPLADALWDTVRRAGVAVRELRLLHLGEKTSAGNAMVAGIGPTRRIYVGDTLSEGVEQEERIDETCVVLAHELGHHVHGDPWRLLAVSSVTLAAGTAAGAFAVDWLAPDGAGHLTMVPALVLGFSVGSTIVSPFQAWYSRRRERAADRYAVEVTGTGDVFARALEHLVAQNLSELEPPRVWHALTASHPAPGERIAAARATRQAVQD
jgi:STE24 endopeptidase